MKDDRPMIVFYYDTETDSNKEPERICSIRVDCFDTWMNMLITCWKHEIDFWVREDDETISKDIREMMSGIGGVIKDISVRFGSDECIQCIDVVL